MSEIKSPHKIAKAARKIYRRDMQSEALKTGRMIGNIMRPKPKYVPWFIWMALVNLVIKVK